MKILFLILIALGMGGITFLNSQMALAAPDRCASIQSKDGGATGTFCSPNKEQAKEAKGLCKSGQDVQPGQTGFIGFGDNVKCSSSQTGFGEFPNSKR